MRYLSTILLVCLSLTTFGHPLPSVDLSKPVNEHRIHSSFFRFPFFHKKDRYSTRANGFTLTAGVIAFSGAGLVAASLTPLVFGNGKPDMTLASVGGSMICVSIPFSLAGNSYNKRKSTAATTSIKRSGSYDTQMELVSTKNEVGLRVHFK